MDWRPDWKSEALDAAHKFLGLSLWELDDAGFMSLSLVLLRSAGPETPILLGLDSALGRGTSVKRAPSRSADGVGTAETGGDSLQVSNYPKVFQH